MGCDVLRHPCDRQEDALSTRAKHYRAHRAHLDEAGRQGVTVLMAGPLVADDGESPVGSLFVIEAKDRAAVELSPAAIPIRSTACGRHVDVHLFNKKRG